MLDRIHGVGGTEGGIEAAITAAGPGGSKMPSCRSSQLRLPRPQLTTSAVEALILKLLLSRGDTTGRQVSDHLKLPFRIIDELLREMKHDQLVVHKGSAADERLRLSADRPRPRAGPPAGRTLHVLRLGAGFAAATTSPAVGQQSLTKQHPTADDLQRAFDDLLINPRMLRRLGPAINSGRGLFLFGAPGNGKTSIAERVTKAFGQYIWIPRAIGIDGEIIRLFDPNAHEEVPLAAGSRAVEPEPDRPAAGSASAGRRSSSAAN